MSAPARLALPRWKTAVLTWLAIYPTITLVGAALQPFTAELAWPLRTFVITLLLVPLMVYAVVPAVFRLAAVVAPQWIAATPIAATSTAASADRTES